MQFLRDAVEAYRTWVRGLGQTQTFDWGVPFLSAGLGKAVPGSLVVVGGRPGSGKSFFGLLLLESVKVPAMYVSLEDTSPEVARRVAPMSNVRLMAVSLSTPTRPRLSRIVADIKAANPKPRLVVVDYLQLVQYDGDIQAWSQSEQIGHIISELKGLARELDFVLVLNCQLRRPDRGLEDKEPSIFDLRDSSNIENSAEVVVLLHDMGDLVRAKVAKNKSGRRGAVATFERSDNGFLVPAPPEEDEELFGDEV